MLAPLAQRGYAVVRLSQASKVQLRSALQAWSLHGRFRHPAVPEMDDGTTNLELKKEQQQEEEARFPEERACFNALFDECRNGIRLLDREWREAKGVGLGAPLQSLPDGEVFLDHDALPFQSLSRDTPFDQSFFNVFNYNHGTLNPHVDRGLITLVYGYNENRSGASQLWLLDLETNMWVEAEEVCEAHDAGNGDDCVLLFAGEQLERLTGGRVRAVEHCVRVDPEGEFLNRSHFTRDPEAAPIGNRLSAAMIFSFNEEERSKI